jgi:thiamine transporter
VLLDYPVPFAVVSLTGLGSRQYRALGDAGKRLLAAAVVVPWMTVGAAARFLSHFASGIFFFGSMAPAGQPVWAYSALYNLGYLLPSLVLCIVVGMLVLPVLNVAVPVGASGAGETAS